MSDVTQAHALSHGREKAVLGDAAYQAAAKRPENAGKAMGEHTAMRAPLRKARKEYRLGRAREQQEHMKAVFATCYRGLAENYV